MRIEPARQAMISRRSGERAERAAAAEAQGEGRALLPDTPAGQVHDAPVRARAQKGAVDAALIAHLIATRDGLAQTRALRRVSSGEGSAAYGAVRNVVRAVPRPVGFSTIA